MTTYHAISTTALAATPQTEVAPQIVNATSSQPADSTGDSSTLPIVDDDSGDPYQLSWYVNRITEITQTLQRDIGLIEQNPIQGLTQLSADVGGLVTDEVGHVGEFLSAFPEVYALPLIAPIGLAGGLAGLAGLAGIAPEGAHIPTEVPAPAPQASPLPAATSSPVAIGAPGVPAAAPASAPVTPAGSVATSVAPPPPAAGPGFVPPYAVGPPGIGTGSGMGSSAGAGDKNKAAEPYAAAATAAAAERGQLRPRRRRRAGIRGYAHEFMEMNINVDPAWTEPHSRWTATSDRGAGLLGFAGTARKRVSAAAGLATLDDDDFGGGAVLPMVPGTWNADQLGEVEAGGEHD